MEWQSAFCSENLPGEISFCGEADCLISPNHVAHSQTHIAANPMFFFLFLSCLSIHASKFSHFFWATLFLHTYKNSPRFEFVYLEISRSHYKAYSSFASTVTVTHVVFFCFCFFKLIFFCHNIKKKFFLREMTFFIQHLNDNNLIFS